MANPLALDPEEAWGEIKRQREKTYPRPPRKQKEPPPLDRYRTTGNGMSARMHAVLWWGRAMRRAAEKRDRREIRRLDHWWEEKVEGWAEDVHRHLEEPDA